METPTTTPATANNSKPLERANPWKFRGKRLEYQLQRIDQRFPLITPTEEQVSDVDCLSFSILAKLEADGKPETWVSLSPRLPCGRLTVFLSMVCQGYGEKAAMEAVGVSAAEIWLCANADRDGFKLLLAEARSWKLEAIKESAIESLKTVVNGLKKPLIGRVDKDQDGILRDTQGKELWETKYSDKAIVFALERLHKRFAPPEIDRSAHAGQGGPTIVYNISVATPQPMQLTPATHQHVGAVIDISEAENGESMAKLVGEE